MKIIARTCIIPSLLMLTAISVCCNKGDSAKEPDGSEVNNEMNSFTEYSLEGMQSHWTNLNPNGDGEPVIVNSDEELSRYIVGTDYPSIDFSKKTLLLMCGGTTNGVDETTARNFQYLSAGRYRLEVEIILGDTDVAQGWTMVILVDKLCNKADIDLSVDVC